ncbi:hypothetical protein NUW58_g6891 [Xylaria curta]|uniref:Uncharacterized protein n=1 Tax=Xylaria curta TaxID=42375 RepID=A0ACC1NQF8_9PEZI|nr:hypothetical protein NUW58_g6891 [Xylaria curta]
MEPKKSEQQADTSRANTNTLVRKEEHVPGRKAASRIINQEFLPRSPAVEGVELSDWCYCMLPQYVKVSSCSVRAYTYQKRRHLANWVITTACGQSCAEPERWFVDVDFEVARRRLVVRHVKAGIASDEEEARKRADENDLVNGRQIVDNRTHVHEVVVSRDDEKWRHE